MKHPVCERHTPICVGKEYVTSLRLPKDNNLMHSVENIFPCNESFIEFQFISVFVSGLKKFILEINCQVTSFYIQYGYFRQVIGSLKDYFY